MTGTPDAECSAGTLTVPTGTEYGCSDGPRYTQTEKKVVAISTMTTTAIAIPTTV